MADKKQITALEIAIAGIAGVAALAPLLGWTWLTNPAQAFENGIASLSWTQLAALSGMIGTVGGAWWLLRPTDLAQTVNDRDAARYLIGDQRTGKTTLASLWFQDDIRTPHSWTHQGRGYSAGNDRGAAWITTHGAADIAALVPPGRLSLFSPPNTRGINILAGGDPYASANRVVTIMERLWPDLGDVQRQLLYTAALTVSQERPRATLHDVVRFCDDPRERRAYAVNSEAAQRSWANPDKGAVRGLITRLDRTLASPRLSLGLADPDGYDLDDEIRKNRVFVADLTQDDTADAEVLAQALVSMFQQVSVRRGSDAQMYPVYLDEFQGYTSASIETWITEGGKRHCPLTLIHQNRSQIEGKKRLAAAALSCGTIYCMRVNVHDAKELAPALGLKSEEAAQLTSLPTRHYRARILSRGRIIHRRGSVPYVDGSRRDDRADRDAARRDHD